MTLFKDNEFIILALTQGYSAPKKMLPACTVGGVADPLDLVVLASLALA